MCLIHIMSIKFIQIQWLSIFFSYNSLTKGRCCLLPSQTIFSIWTRTGPRLRTPVLKSWPNPQLRKRWTEMYFQSFTSRACRCGQTLLRFIGHQLMQDVKNNKTEINNNPASCLNTSITSFDTSLVMGKNICTC